LFLTTKNLIGQNLDSIKVARIDSSILSVSEDIKNGDNYTTSWSYDFLYKKYLGLLKKQIGAYSLRIIHHDSLIFSTNRVYRYTDNRETNELFYFTNNRLIKYEKKILISGSSLNNNPYSSIIVYFDRDRIIKQVSNNYRFGAIEQQKVCKMLSTERLVWIKLITEANDLSKKD
jgi:hypothetical protein